jgi:hypothetical protein
MTFSRIAIDKAAEDYWTSYYADTGYGEIWVRKIPKMIKTAMFREANLDVRAIDILPFATTTSPKGVWLEGLASAGEKRVAFVAEFSHEGDLMDFEVYQQ